MRVIKLDSNKTIVSIKNLLDGYILKENEMVSDDGGLGQIQQEDGNFIDPIPSQIIEEATLEDKVNYLYYKGMGVI